MCVSHRMHLLYCIWIPSLCVRVFSLIRQIGVDAMRGDERRASPPWQEIRGSSDARLHRLCVAPVSPRHPPSVTCWDTVTLCMRVCLCWSRSPCGKAHSVWIDFLFSFFSFSFCTLVPLDTRPVFVFYGAGCQTLKHLHLHLSLSSFLPSFPSSYPLSHHHYVCDLCPYDVLDAFPGCSQSGDWESHLGSPPCQTVFQTKWLLPTRKTSQKVMKEISPMSRTVQSHSRRCVYYGSNCTWDYREGSSRVHDLDSFAMLHK